MFSDCMHIFHPNHIQIYDSFKYMWNYLVIVFKTISKIQVEKLHWPFTFYKYNTDKV